MTGIILLTFFALIAIIAITGRKQVPWMNKLRRVRAGVANQAEWLASEQVITDVQQQYLEAMRWLPESVLMDWSQQWSGSPTYFSGLFLKRHQEILKNQRMRPPRYVGVMRCIHQLQVRHFSDDGERCLLIDQQKSRRIATYNYWTHERHSTQDLGDTTVVYEMIYDKQQQRWKINRFIQELPIGWNTKQHPNRVKLLSELPPSSGRDS